MITILANHALHEIVEVRRMLGIDEVKVFPWNDDRIMRIAEVKDCGQEFLSSSEYKRHL